MAIFGCGGVGLGAVAASSFRGAKTIAVDVSDEKLEKPPARRGRHIRSTQCDSHCTSGLRNLPMDEARTWSSKRLGCQKRFVQRQKR